MAVTAVTTVAIVGAGIAGLAAAWELQRAGVAVTLLESERRAGGGIVTQRRDGFIGEGGPDGVLPAGPRLPPPAAGPRIPHPLPGPEAPGPGGVDGRPY